MEESTPEFVALERDDPSLWFRPLRQLVEDGKPLPETTILAFGPLPEGDLPFGAICRTHRQRVVFWSALPRGLRLFGDERVAVVTDHVTLELPSGKTHATSYEESGASKHHRRGWRLENVGETGLALWFSLLVRRCVLEEQHRAVERNVRVPRSDRDRREAEFRKYAQQLRFQPVRIPPGGDTCSFFYFAIYLERSEQSHPELPPGLSQLGSFPDGLVRGWPDNSRIALQPMRFALGDLRLLFVTAAPPGELAAEYFGFPRGPTYDPCSPSSPGAGPELPRKGAIP